MAGDIYCAVVRAAAATGGGDQTFTASGRLGSKTPKAALFFMSTAVTDGTVAQHMTGSIGACDATRQWAIAGQSEDSSTLTDAGRRRATNECIMLLTQTGGIDGEANFSSFGTESVTVTWGNAPAAAYLVTVILFAGDDLQARADTHLLGALNTEVQVDDVGFQPDVVFLGHADAEPADSFNNDLRFSFGVCVDDGAATQRNWAVNDRHNTTFKVASEINNAHGVASMGTDAMSYEVEVANFDTAGFSIFTRIAGAGSDNFSYLALDVDDRQKWVGTVTAPTGTGSNSVSTPGFKPQIVIQGITTHDTVNITETDGTGGGYGVSVFDDTNEFSQTWANEDTAGTSDTQSLSDDQAINLYNDDGATQAKVATFTQFETDGWTLNYTTNDAVANLFWALAIEERTVAGITPATANLVLSPTAPTLDHDLNRDPAQGNLVLSFTAPTLDHDLNRDPGQANLVLSPTAPTRLISLIKEPAVVDLVLSPTAPALDHDLGFFPAQGNLVITTTDPDVLNSGVLGAKIERFPNFANLTISVQAVKLTQTGFAAVGTASGTWVTVTSVSDTWSGLSKQSDSWSVIADPSQSPESTIC